MEPSHDSDSNLPERVTTPIPIPTSTSISPTSPTSPTPASTSLSHQTDRSPSTRSPGDLSRRNSSLNIAMAVEPSSPSPPPREDRSPCPLSMAQSVPRPDLDLQLCFVPLPQNYFQGGMFSDTRPQITLLTPAFVKRHFKIDEDGCLTLLITNDSPAALEHHVDVTALVAHEEHSIVPRQLLQLRLRPENLALRDDRYEQQVQRFLHNNEYGLEMVTPHSIQGGILGFSRGMIVAIDPPNLHGQPGFLKAMFFDNTFGRYPARDKPLFYQANTFDHQGPPPNHSFPAPIPTSVRDPVVRAHEAKVAALFGLQIPSDLMDSNSSDDDPPLSRDKAQAERDYYRDLGYSSEEEVVVEETSSTPKLSTDSPPPSPCTSPLPLNQASDQIPMPPSLSSVSSLPTPPNKGVFQYLRACFSRSFQYLRRYFQGSPSEPTTPEVPPPCLPNANTSIRTSTEVPKEVSIDPPSLSTPEAVHPVRRVHRYGGRRQARTVIIVEK